MSFDIFFMTQWTIKSRLIINLKVWKIEMHHRVQHNSLMKITLMKPIPKRGTMKNVEGGWVMIKLPSIQHNEAQGKLKIKSWNDHRHNLFLTLLNISCWAYVLFVIVVYDKSLKGNTKRNQFPNSCWLCVMCVWMEHKIGEKCMINCIAFCYLR